MVGLAELNALHATGSELRARLAQSPASGSPDELRRIARSTVLDLLGARQELATPILEVLEQLLATRAVGSAEASLAAIQQQLQRTYNGPTIQLTLAFARGTLGLNPEAPDDRPAEPWAPTAPLRPRPSTSPQGLAAFNQSLMLLMALGSIGVISFLAIRNTNGPASTPAAKPTNNGAATAPVSPATPPAPSPRPNAPAPAGDEGSLFDAGVAVGGQRVLVDTSSISATPDAGRMHFRYWLGNASVEAVADCNRHTWTSYPEAETHSPQSAATARMLTRVCEGRIASPVAAAPTQSASGAGLVFDPPSNIRATPNGAILCSVTSRGSIPIQGREGNWYRTDFCGTPGYIHRGQIRF